MAEPREHGGSLEQQASAESSVRDVAALGCLVDGLAIDVEKLGDLVGRQDHRGIVHDTHSRHAGDLGDVWPLRLAGSWVESGPTHAVVSGSVHHATSSAAQIRGR